jgi:hypothetical protein
MKVFLSNGKSGKIQSSFGSSGKFKIKMDVEVNDEDVECTLRMPFKKLIFDKTHKRIQDF